MRMIHHVSAGESGRNSERKLPGFLGLTSFMCAHESPLCGLSSCSSQVLVFLSCVDGVFSHLEIPKRADPCVESPTPAFNNTSPLPPPTERCSFARKNKTHKNPLCFFFRITRFPGSTVTVVGSHLSLSPLDKIRPFSILWNDRKEYTAVQPGRHTDVIDGDHGSRLRKEHLYKKKKFGPSTVARLLRWSGGPCFAAKSRRHRK